MREVIDVAGCDPDEYWDEAWTSKISKFSTQTLRNWRHQGKGIPYLKIGRAIRYKRADVIRFLESNRIEPKLGC